MNRDVWIAVLLLLLVLTPFLLLLGSTLSDLRETKRQMKKNEEEIRRMIDRM